MKLLIANWKAQMTLGTTRTWLAEFTRFLHEHKTLIDNLQKQVFTIVICPPFPFLPIVQEALRQYPYVQLGVQTISSFENGKFTGEVTVDAVKDFATYAIIGHSEQRRHHNLSETYISDQLNLCKKNNIKSILCIRGVKDELHEADTIAYEPVAAIGSGQNADLEEVLSVKKTLRIESGRSYLYGGSADQHNITEYLKSGEIDGFLVGTASLSASSFFAMARAMNSLL